MAKMSEKQKQRRRLRKKIGKVSAYLDETYDLEGMDNDELRKLYEELKPLYGQAKRELSPKNIAGHSDYTPYNAITGKDVISSGKLTDPQTKTPGGYNSTKK